MITQHPASSFLSSPPPPSSMTMPPSHVKMEDVTLRESPYAQRGVLANMALQSFESQTNTAGGESHLTSFAIPSHGIESDAALPSHMHKQIASATPEMAATTTHNSAFVFGGLHSLSGNAHHALLTNSGGVAELSSPLISNNVEISSYVTSDIYLRSTNGDPALDVHYPQNPSFEEHLRALNEINGAEPQSLFMLNTATLGMRVRRPPGALPYTAPPPEAYRCDQTDADGGDDDDEGDDNAKDMRPHRQDEKLRFPGDLYTPRWVRGHGTQRQGWCSLCEEGAWMQLKTSQYWYHVRFTHGVNSNTGRIYEPPLQLRVFDDTFGSTFGLCGECHCWIPICTPRRKRTFTSWFKHAHKCHRGRHHAGGGGGGGGGGMHVSGFGASNAGFLINPMALYLENTPTFTPTSTAFSAAANVAANAAPAYVFHGHTPSHASSSPPSGPIALSTSGVDSSTSASPEHRDRFVQHVQPQQQRFSWPVSLNGAAAMMTANSQAPSSSSTFNAASNMTTQALQAAYADVQAHSALSSLHRRSASGPCLL